jgi:hypothetical protein
LIYVPPVLILKIWNLKNKKFWEKTNLILSFDMTWTAKKITPPIIIHCRGNVFTKLLPSKERGYTERPTDSPLMKHDGTEK